MDTPDDPEYIPTSSKSDGEPASSRNEATATRKRRRRTTTGLSSAPPLKRQKGVFNPRYLALLNKDIADAVAGTIKEEDRFDVPSLAPSQIGAISWSAPEKRAFFTALSRLGRDDLPGVAARINNSGAGVKSELEVRQYATLLDGADQTRRYDSRKQKRAPLPAEMSAATELSTSLCACLEDAADALALRQEAHETAVEQRRWGAGRWLVTAELARMFERQVREQRQQQQQRHHENDRAPTPANDTPLPPFAELFVLRNWLRLSDRIFMNSAVVPDGNWRSVSEEAPSIRTTAVADFHSLAVSVTRRLISATLYVAGSRVRAKRIGDRRGRIGALVKAKDVHAAAASIGMRENSRDFWARAARRLRLDVYDDKVDEDQESATSTGNDENSSDGDEDENADVDTAEDEDSEDENDAESDIEEDIDEINTHMTDIPYEHEPTILSYDAIEAALGFPIKNQHPPSHPENNLPEISSSDTDSLPEDEAEADPENENQQRDSDTEDATPIDEAVLALDLNEALTYSALDNLDTTDARRTLQRRLRTEQRLWIDADHLDAQSSAAEEARLWSLLRGGESKMEEDRGKGREAESSDKQKLAGGRIDMVDLGTRNWRDRTEYYGEWEVVEDRSLR